jgi:hypothetical protein
LASVWREIRTGRPVLWTDDDITVELNKGQRRELRKRGVKLVAPYEARGLTQRDLQEIWRWLSEQRHNQAGRAAA